jgi:hypothetical protein
MARRDDRGSFEFGATGTASRRRRNWWWLLIPLLLAAGGGYVYMFERDRAVEALRGTPLAIEPNVTRAYKWRDRQGGWQLSDQPPAPGIKYEVLEHRSDENVMPLVPRDR